MTLRRHLLQSLTGIACTAGLLGWPSLGFGAGAKKVALVVGNADYAGTERLKNPVADATLTAENLRKLGFQANLVTDRNTAQLKADLEAFGQAAQGADIALFFYAGHGIAVENINYLLAVDQTLAAATSLGLKRQGVSLRWIESLLRQGGAAVSLIVVDACRNTLMRGMPQQGMAATPRAARGTLTFYSTAPGALARDGAGKNSEFSGVFNRHLSNPDLSIKQIVESTQRDVSAETGDTQVPWINSGLVGDVKLYTAQSLGPELASKPGASIGRTRGVGGEPAAALRGNFWNENLAQLEEQVQFAVMNFDIQSKPVIEQRAAAGDVMALTILGSVYAATDTAKTVVTRGAYGLESKTVPQGNGVVAADPARAARYLAKAADRRFPIAQTLLAELLVEAPRGVPRDLQRAENLLQDAAATGYGRARLDLLDLKARRGTLSPEELMKSGGVINGYMKSMRIF